MKFRNPGRTTAAVVVLIAQTLIMTACSSTTIDFLYVATNKLSPGQINAYEVDHVSGALHQINTSPFPAGKNPVALVASPNGRSLYVANQDDNTILQYAIGTDGKLYPHSTFQSKGGSAVPVAIAVDPLLNNLYVAYTYQPGYSALNPGPGDMVAVNLNSDGSFGSQVLNVNGKDFWTVGYGPTAIAIQQVSATDINVYVTSNSTSGGVPVSSVYEETLTSAGVISGGSYNFASLTGMYLSGVAAEPSGKYFYVTDQGLNQIYAFKLSATYAPQRIVTSAPIVTGNGPSSITVAPDPAGGSFYLLVADYGDGRVISYSVPLATGIPPLSATASQATSASPIAIAVEPEQGRFVYTANFTDNTVSGLLLETGSGALIATQNTPYKSNGQPTAIAIVPHGANPVI
jgi:6-phosphogluconolactonase (cycloisomerase 2 family)